MKANLKVRESLLAAKDSKGDSFLQEYDALSAKHSIHKRGITTLEWPKKRWRF